MLEYVFVSVDRVVPGGSNGRDPRGHGVGWGANGSLPATRGWTFLTNHTHVLVAVSRDPELRQREIGALVGITEGAVQRILNELEDAGYLRRERIGRRNRYHVVAERPLRHPLEGHRTVGDLLDAVRPPDEVTHGRGSA